MVMTRNAVGTAQREVRVEGDGLVLGLLDGVPQPEPPHLRLHLLAELGVREHELGQYRREVLEGAR